MMLKSKLLNKMYHWLSGAILVCLLTACSIDSVLETDAQEEGREVDPSLVVTRAGGIALYNRALQDLQLSVNVVSQYVGLMTDELANGKESDQLKGVDARQSGRDADGRSYGVMMHNFGELQSVRITAGQAIAIMKSLNDPSMNGLIAAAYAFQGYSLLLLAENYCSGVPLTEVPFDGDVVYGNSQSTSQVLTVAVAKFDSALAISHDSAKFVQLARIGKARSLMSLGNYKEAAEAVVDILPEDVFHLSYTNTPPPGSSVPSLAFWPEKFRYALTPEETLQILNEEGDNGMIWYDDPDNIDPRVPVSTVIVDGDRVFPENVTQKKFESGTLSFPLARGIEAMLIRAEYALKQGDTEWLDPINQARATIGLVALTDPGDEAGRVDLLFKERARWLYLEGFRLADFRRLVRQYGRNPYTVYPIGLYTQSRGEIPFYGDAWVFGVPKDEYVNNYRYQGCLSWNP